MYQNTYIRDYFSPFLFTNALKIPLKTIKPLLIYRKIMAGDFISCLYYDDKFIS